MHHTYKVIASSDTHTYSDGMLQDKTTVFVQHKTGRHWHCRKEFCYNTTDIFSESPVLNDIHLIAKHHGYAYNEKNADQCSDI